MNPRIVGCVLSGYVLAVLALMGCAGPDVRLQSPEDAVAEPTSQTRIVGDLSVPYGLHPVKVEEVALVTRLRGTGSDPAPGPQRAALVDEMQARGVLYPNHVLASPDTSMILVRGYLRPGIQKGDRFDLEVRIPSNSETTSLRGGWMMETRLKEMAVVGNQIHDGHVLALGEGPLLVDPSATDKKDAVMLGRARILGGGVALKTRPLGLVLKPGKQSVSNSAAVGAALNRRFHTFAQGIKQGVATPKTDEYIELNIHPRYKDNVERFLMVVRAVPLRESPSEQSARLKLLDQQLNDPVTSATAAVRLEALGTAAIDVLKRGIRASDGEVRFYAAEALAYLDQSEAAEPLGKVAAEEPAFRAFALTALSAMDAVSARDELEKLLHVGNAEARYGAFRSLWAMNAQDPLIRGRTLGDGQFHLHVIESSGPPMVHVTRSFRPEVVLFGRNQRLQPPLSVEAGNDLLLKADPARPDEVIVSRYVAEQQDQKRAVSNRLEDVVQAVAELGGTYPDVVQLLQNAKEAGALASRFDVDALPSGGRNYERLAKSEDQRADDGADASGDTDSTNREMVPDNPVPGLFARRPERWSSDRSTTSETTKSKPEKRPSLSRWFGKMRGTSGGS